jgi:hypothetical protein
MKDLKKDKRGVMGAVISVFVLLLVISILSGLTFLFVANLKTQAITSSDKVSRTVVNESTSITPTAVYLATYGELAFTSATALEVINTSSKLPINTGNYTLTSAGLLTGATGGVQNWSAVSITYSYSTVGNKNPYITVNTTETAGSTVVNYLPLIFLAIIFGAILTLVLIVLNIILPYINLGQQVSSFS